MISASRLVVALALGSLVATGGCASIQREAERRQAAEESARREAIIRQVKAEAEEQYAKRQITFGQMVERVAQEEIRLSPNNLSLAETARFAIVAGYKVDRKEITQDEYRFLVTQKLNETRRADNASATNTAIARAALISTLRPTGSRCVSTRSGETVTTNCD